MIIRAGVALPILGVWLTLALGLRALASPLWPRILLRALILCSAYLSFILSMAAMPMANTVAIYFTMPFFVAGLAGPFFGERVPLYRWIAITAGFVGVIVMVRPGMQAFEPASLLALYSAFGYAVGQMMGRKLAQEAPPLVIANWQNAVYLACSVLVGLAAQATGFAGEGHKSLAFLTRPWIWPSLPDFLLLSFLGVLAAFTIVSFVSAYKFAESSFVAPFEYSAMAWAIVFGLLFFNDFPDLLTWAGMAIVVGAGLFMLIMDRRARIQTG
jgi:drug/metabolite transporter (DMT)-like permease